MMRKEKCKMIKKLEGLNGKKTKVFEESEEV